MRHFRSTIAVPPRSRQTSTRQSHHRLILFFVFFVLRPSTPFKSSSLQTWHYYRPLGDRLRLVRRGIASGTLHDGMSSMVVHSTVSTLSTAVIDCCRQHLGAQYVSCCGCVRKRAFGRERFKHQVVRCLFYRSSPVLCYPEMQYFQPPRDGCGLASPSQKTNNRTTCIAAPRWHDVFPK
jgi:hypothetical protein